MAFRSPPPPRPGSLAAVAPSHVAGLPAEASAEGKWSLRGHLRGGGASRKETPLSTLPSCPLAIGGLTAGDSWPCFSDQPPHNSRVTSTQPHNNPV